MTAGTGIDSVHAQSFMKHGRAGMHPEVLESMIAARPKRIVYISCNPATQARDLIKLTESYRIEEVQPFDMFPQTHHMENIVSLKRIE